MLDLEIAQLQRRYTTLRVMDHVLPMLTTGRAVDPTCPDRLLSETEERALIVKQLSALPKRWGLFANRLEGRTATLRSMGIDLDKAHASAKALSSEVRQRFAQGRFGVPRDELIASRERVPVTVEEVHEAPRKTVGRKQLRLVMPS